MKRTRTKFAALAVTVLMALLCIMTAFGGLFQSAYADEEVNYTTKENCSIYYFCDYYPSLSAKKLSAEYVGLPVCYEYMYVYEQGFYTLIDENYFSGFNSDQIVIIDLKTFKPDETKLVNLFNSFRNEINKLMFVSAYPASEYTDTTFGGNVDSFIYDNCKKLDCFIGHAVQNLFDKNNTFGNTAILLDGKLVNPVTLSSDMDTKCQSSPFLRILLEKLAARLMSNQDFDSYNSVVDTLARNNVKLIMHYEGDCYRDLMTGSLYLFDSISDVYNKETYADKKQINHVCAMGFWRLNQAFYNFLKAGKGAVGTDNLPVYIMEVEPITYSEGGLDIITDSDLESAYGEFDDDVAREMLNELSGWL